MAVVSVQVPFATAKGMSLDPKVFVADLDQVADRVVFTDVDPIERRYMAGPWHRAFAMTPSQVFATVCENMPGETRLRADAAMSGVTVQGFVKKPAKRAKTPCYYTSLSFTGDRQLHINEIYVNENLRGNGIGSALRRAIWQVADIRDTDEITLVAGWSHGASSWAQSGAVLDAGRNREQYDANLGVLRKRILGLIESHVLDAQAIETLSVAITQPDEKLLQHVASVRTDLSSLFTFQSTLLKTDSPLSIAFDPNDDARMTLRDAVNITRTEAGKVPAGNLLLSETYWPCRIDLHDQTSVQRYRAAAGMAGPAI